MCLGEDLKKIKIFSVTHGTEANSKEQEGKGQGPTSGVCSDHPAPCRESPNIMNGNVTLDNFNLIVTMSASEKPPSPLLR